MTARRLALFAVLALAGAGRPDEVDHDALNLPGIESTNITVFQMNVLADGLAKDGFLMPRRMDRASEIITPGSGKNRFYERVLSVSRTMAAARAMDDFKQLAKNKDGKSKEKMKDILESVGPPSLSVLMNVIQIHAEQSNEEQIVAWSRRGQLLVDIIKKEGCPDIITLQELDKYTFLANGLRKACPHHEVGNIESYAAMTRSHSKKCDSDAYEQELAALAEAKIPYAPKCSSNAYKFSKSPDKDDDGVAIFWNKNKFSLVEMKFSIIGEKRDAPAMLVKLRTTQDKSISVVTSHLSSGPEKESQRHAELNVIYNDLIDGREEPIIFALDMNSDLYFEPDFEAEGGENSVQKVKSWKFASAWERHREINHGRVPMTVNKSENSVQKVKSWKFASAWERYREINHGRVPMTVNKMRGPASDQPNKWGEYALETIDHVFWKANSTLQFQDVDVVVPKELGRIQLTPDLQKSLRASAKSDHCQGREGLKKCKKDASMMSDIAGITYEDKLKELFWNMQPSLFNPSDHFPVKATFTLF